MNDFVISPVEDPNFHGYFKFGRGRWCVTKIYRPNYIDQTISTKIYRPKYIKIYRLKLLIICEMYILYIF